MMNGVLVLTLTDLVLPGNAGRALRFQRTFNSKDHRWTFGIAGLAMGIADPPLPTQGVNGPQDQTPTLAMSDGANHRMAWDAPTPGSAGRTLECLGNSAPHE